MLYVADLLFLCQRGQGKVRVEDDASFSFKDWLQRGNKGMVKEISVTKASFRNCIPSKLEIQEKAPTDRQRVFIITNLVKQKCTKK